MPWVIKYCPRCIKGARGSVMTGTLISILTYYSWDYLGLYIWAMFFIFVFLKCKGIV